MDMFPPGRIVFVRPIKQLDEHGRKAGPKQWDTVWIEPTEIIGEGILISPRVSAHKLGQTVLHATVHMTSKELHVKHFDSAAADNLSALSESRK